MRGGRDMRVLVTGGLGYLGGRIVQALAGRPDVAVRVLAHGARPLPSGFPPGVEVRRGDVLNPESLRGVCDGVSHVVHLAGLNQAASRKSPGDALAISGSGTLHLASEAAEAGAGRFLYVSSIHVYGAARTGRVSEEAPTVPVSWYGASRVVGELTAQMVGRDRGLSVVVLRLSNGYGPPAYPGTTCWELMVNDLCRQAARRGEIALRTSGTQLRDFVAVTDIVRAIDLFASAPDGVTGGGTFNVGSGRLHTVLSVAECVRDAFAEVSGRRIPIHVGAEAAAEPPMPHVDITRARAVGYVPEADLREELHRTLAAAAGPLGEDAP